jgi:hypothetical protein
MGIEVGTGGATNFIGWFTDPTQLRTLYPAAQSGQYATVGSTDTVWTWDADAADWYDTGFGSSGTTVAADINMDGNAITSTGYIDMDTSYAGAMGEGRLAWNGTDGTLNVGMPGGNVNLQVGQEQLIRVKASEAITDGELVYIDGADGANPTISLADASNAIGNKTIAMATEYISNGQNGYVTTFGLVRTIPVPTATYSAGDELWLGSTAGQFTNTEPAHPNYKICIGYVLRAHDTEGVVFVRINNAEFLKRMQATGDPTGYDSMQTQLNPDIAFDNGTRTFTASVQGGQTYFNYWINGTEYRKTSNQTVVIANTTGLHYIYFDGDTLTSSMTPWTFNANYVFTAIVYWYATDGAGLLLNERHGISMDWSTHQYLHDTVSVQYESGLAGTFNDNGSFTITAGELHDEDIELSIAQQTDCTLLWRDGSLDWDFSINQSKFYVEAADVIQYDNAGTLTDVPNASHVSYYIFGTNDTNDPIWSIAGQRTDVTLANARLNQGPDSLTLGTLPSPEMKLLYRVIVKRNGTSETVEDTIDYRTTQAIGSNNFVSTSHLSLTDLTTGDSGHNQFALLAGRASGQTLIGGTAASETLTLQSTSNATKGKLLFGTSAYDEVNNRLGIADTTPDYPLEVSGVSKSTGHLQTTQTLTDAATVTVNVNSGYDMTITYGGDRTMGAPSNLVAGGSGTITASAGASARTITWNSVYRLNGSSGPTTNFAASSVNKIYWHCPDGTNVDISIGYGV